MLDVRCFGLSSVLLLGCGPKVEEPAELRELCGQEAPVQLLTLSETESVPAGSRAIVGYGDRYLVGVHTFASPPATRLAANEEPIGTRVVSVDRCGDDGEPLEVGTGFSVVYAPDDGGPWLGANPYTREVFEFDPEGTSAPVLVCEDCSVVTRHDRQYIFSVGDEVGELREPGAATPLIEAGEYPQWDSEHRIFYAEDDVLWSYNLETAERSSLFDGVGAFSVSDDGTVFATSPQRDRTSESAWTFRDEQGVPLFGPFTGRLLRKDNTFTVVTDDAPTILVDASNATQSSHDSRWQEQGHLDDGRRLMFDWSTQEVGWFDAATGDVEVSMTADLVEAKVQGTEAFVWDYGPRSPAGYRDVQTTQLLRSPGDGDPEVVLDDVHQPLALDDGRWVTVREIKANDTGELWVIDPRNDDAALIERNVDLFLTRFVRPVHMFPGDDPYPSDAPFFYTRRDAGADSGLWTVALE